jgi:hypothetical protein
MIRQSSDCSSRSCNPDYDSHDLKAKFRCILTLMKEHRVPRWITMLWLAFVVSLTSTSIVVVVRLNCDFVWSLGFLVASSIVIFASSVVAWLALYGLSILLEGLEYRKTHCDDSKRWGGLADLIP